MGEPETKLTRKLAYRGTIKPDRPLVFGLDTEDSLMKEFVNPNLDLANPNPMVRAVGRGAKGTTCKGCTFLEHHSAGGNWLKCGKQKEIRGVNVDMRAGYDACSLFEAGGQKHIQNW